jgi:hypothetical protein
VILAVWIVALCLLGLWSLAGWGLHALLASGVQWAGELKPLLERIPLSAWIERWVPGWIDALHMAADLMQGLLGWLGGAAPVLVWVVWAIGAVLLLGLAMLLTVVIALVRKNSPPRADA